jgi:hypothetical protein
LKDSFTPEDQSCFDKNPLEVVTKSRLVDDFDKYRAKVNLGERNMTYEYEDLKNFT